MPKTHTVTGDIRICQAGPGGGVIERHNGTIADAKRVLRQWMEDDDTYDVRQHDDGVTCIFITTAEGEGGSDIYAAFMPL